MARTVTESSLVQRILQRANLENHSNFADTNQVIDLLNTAVTEVYDILVAASPPDYFSTDFTITTVSGQTSYDLPSDFYKLRAVFVNEGDNEYRPISAINEQERQYFRPPAGAYSVIMRYIPSCPIIDDDVGFDGIDGWDELAVTIAAINLLTRESANIQLLPFLDAQRSRLEQRIRGLADRNPGEPQRVVRRSLRYRDTFRAWANTVDAYQPRAGSLDIFRTAGSYLL